MQNVPGKESPSVNHLAFVDDTVWISNTKEGIERILSKTESFFTRNDIEINTDKTIVIHKNINDLAYPELLTTDTDDTEYISFCERLLKVSERHVLHRYLGIW